MKSFDEQLQHLIQEALDEDVGDGDHSTLSCIPLQQKGKAVLKIKEDCVLAGVEIAQTIFSYVEIDANITVFKKDGETVHDGETAFEVVADVHTILKCERLVLNCMQRMSGIATLTRSYDDKLAGYRTELLDTRKTTPNFRLLEKEAVRIGGGLNHRFGLFDMIMLKDNHIDYCGSIEKAIEKAWDYVRREKPGLKIEIEARNFEDVKKICSVGKGKVFRIMLDNFRPDQIAHALELIKNDFETEASGGINLENIGQYAATGVDYVSVGGLIHQAQSLDLSLKAVIT